MKGSKPLISNALSILLGNLERTGDPLGLRQVYWTGWAEDHSFPRTGKTLLFTARMYQMLPYITGAAGLLDAARSLVSLKGGGMLLDLGNRIAGERVVRFRARSARAIKEKGTRTLGGIAAALKSVGVNPAYLYEQEPYSGTLLYDLGLEGDLVDHVDRVYRLFKDHGVEEVICVDPHTTLMLREVFPRYIGNYDLRVSHYLEILARDMPHPVITERHGVPDKFVIHDSCVMTRDLGMTQEARRVCEALGIRIVDPENTGTDTACCGGPVEYAFVDLTRQVSSIRIDELAATRQDIAVTCPICLLNLSREGESRGARVWDVGEILFGLLGGRWERGTLQRKGTNQR